MRKSPGSFLWLRKCVNAALEFLSAPTAGTQIVGIVGNCGARLATDARIAAVVLRQIANLVCGGVFPDLSPGPIGERADFGERFAGREAVKFGLFEIFARGGLFATKAGEPGFVGAEGAEKRIDFAKLAALCRIVAIQNAKRRLLRGDALGGNYVDEVELPLARDRVAKRVRFREVIPRFEKQDGNLRNLFAKKMQDNHVFRLKAAGEAGAGCEGAGKRGGDNFAGGADFERFQIVCEAHQSAPFPRVVPLRFTRFAICRAASKKSSGDASGPLASNSK